MDKIAICAIFKDEAPYLLEWLAFHRMIGVDLFVLYRQRQHRRWRRPDPRLELCQERHADRVARAAGPALRLQPFPHQSRVAVHLGRVHRHRRIHHAARRQFHPRHPDAPRLPALCGDTAAMAGVRAVRPRPPTGWAGDRELYAPAAGSGRRQPPHQVDRADRRSCCGIDYTPHAAECSGPACNTRGEAVLPYAIQPTECHDVMVVHHYFTKSVEDWEFKRRRGRGNSLEPYQERVFADVANEATIEDTRALRFVPRLRALLRP